MTSMLRLALCLLLGACGAPPHHTVEGPAETRVQPAPEAPAENAPPSAGPEDEPPNPEIARLVASLDEDADPLHSDYTPSVSALSIRGVPAARAVLHLLDVDDQMTRLHAQRVVEGVVSHEFGFRSGSGFPSREMDDAARRWIVAWGYAYDGPSAHRREGITRIAASLDSLPGAAEREAPAPAR